MSGARLLDLTRSLRRAGRMATGVDRVELAYLDRFINDDVPVYGIMRTAFGYVLVDREGMRAFQARLLGQAPWGAPSTLSRLARGRSAVVQAAETEVRQWAIERSLRGGLDRLLQRQFTQGFSYFNVGHSNLTDRMLQGVARAGGTVDVLIHDVIPLDFPQFQRAETVEPFRSKLRRVSAHADRVIYNSLDTQHRTAVHFEQMGRVPPSVVAYLGIVPAVVKTEEVPCDVMPSGPYFITVGTIEPRKNHAFLLDLWDRMGPEAPPLLICGARGWNNDDVFTRLDKLPVQSSVREYQGLSDGAIATLVKGSVGALVPSFAEGFGLPVVEALSLQARVLCNNLPVFHEIVAQNVIYAPVSDANLWISTLNEWKKSTPDVQDSLQFEAPTWDEHFNTALRMA